MGKERRNLKGENFLIPYFLMIILQPKRMHPKSLKLSAHYIEKTIENNKIPLQTYTFNHYQQWYKIELGIQWPDYIQAR